MDCRSERQVPSAALAGLWLPGSRNCFLPFSFSRCWHAPYRRTISSLSVNPVVSGDRVARGAAMLSNYAFERAVKSLARGAAGASEIVAPAAPSMRWRAAAQRRRYVSDQALRML